MKTHHAWILYACLGGSCLAALDNQVAPAPGGEAAAVQVSTPQIIDRGNDQRVWEQTVTNRLDADHVIVRTNRWTELASGINYWDQNQWKVSRAEFSIVADGAEARQGPHKVHLAGNINTIGAVNLTTRDEKTLRAHVVALAYTDTATGNSVLLGQIQDSIGQLFPPNQVIYQNAFAGLWADIRYTYTRSGFEQDVILRQNPPTPANAGLNPATTVLEVWTEFIEAPEPVTQVRPIKELHDEWLQFGEMHMIKGAAFSVDAPPPQNITASVGKTWLKLGNRTYLIESVQHSAIVGQLAALPALNAAIPKEKNSRMALLSKVEVPKAAKSSPVKTALNIKEFQDRKGLVVDWPVHHGYETNVTFQADTTYLVSGGLNLYGTATFEGGTIIKYASTNVEGSLIQTWNDVVFKSDQYRPVIFTSQNDNTVGQNLYVTGAATNYFGALANAIYDLEYKNFRISYAMYGLHAYSMKVRNAQFTHCDIALLIDQHSAEVDNVLFYEVTNAFGGYNFTAAGRNVTVNQCGILGGGVWANPANSSLALTNSLLVNVATNGGIVVTTNYTVSTTNAIFQTVGAGAHYLADPSPYRDAGTTNIPATLTAALKKRTTYPPVIIAPGGYCGVSQTLSPRCGWDTDIPDLGYHYDPIDYAVSFIYLTNATIQVDPGSAIAIFNPTNSTLFGLGVGDNARFQFNGRADSKITLTHYATVQEMANTNWNGPLDSLAVTSEPPAGSPEFRCRFTDFTVMANGPALFNWTQTAPLWQFTDCQFHSGAINDSGAPFAFTNCLFNRCQTSIDLPDLDVTNWFYDCTFYGGTFNAGFLDANHARMHDTLMADVSISSAQLTSSHIGYLGTNRLALTTNASDKVLTSLVFQTGPLGYFYIPSNALVNAGSRNATDASLYHYTMLTNNVKETNTTVDIGFHYVATDANGTPLGSDIDGIPDYWEDTNGNGSVDSGETSWLVPDTDGDGVNDGLEVLQGRNPLGSGTLSDTNNLLNLRVYTPLK